LNLQSLTLKNFKSYGPDPQTIDLSNIDAVGIGGRNGAGKSTLIEALTFALYGKASATEVRELGDDALINDRASEAYVSVTFEKDGNTYTVERTIRRKGAAKARLTSQIMPHPIADVKAVNAKVESILGMGYETFVSSTIIRQDEMDRLTARRPAERKEMLAKIFGLQAYEMMREKAHEKAWQVKNEIAALEATKRALEESISKEEAVKAELGKHEFELKLLEADRKRVESRKSDVEAMLAEIQEKKVEYDIKNAERMTLAERLRRDEETAQSLSRQMAEAERAAIQLESLKSRLEDRTRILDELREKSQQSMQLKISATEWQEKARSIEQKIREEIENYLKIKAYAVPQCPICKRPLDESHRRQLIDEYEQRILSLQKEREQASEKAESAAKKLHEEVAPAIEKAERSLKELEEVDRKVGELTTTINRLPQLKEEKMRVDELIAQAKNRLGLIEKMLGELAPIIQSYTRLDEELRKLEEELAKIQQKLGMERANIDRAKEDLAEIERRKNEYKVLIEEIAEKEKVRSAYELLEKQVFHKDGIPTALLMEIVPEIEQEASNILRELSDGRMDVSFKFGRITRSGKPTEELIVEAVEDSRSHPVIRYSGGERMRINLAIRLGVSEVIARRSGYKGKIETLVVDEGFGPLDEEGRRATVEILQALRQRFKKIIVISHIDDVREAFETRLQVTKPVGGYSTITTL
jgi:exonuclease SbcC